MKKISVIIPCYDVADYIDRCMATIIGQTIGIDSLEIICVDDCSTDDTWSHLQRWKKFFPEDILLFRQEINGRQGAARNTGLKNASTDWIAFVDADDWLEPDYFEQLYFPTLYYDCDVVSCGWATDTSCTLMYFDKTVSGEVNEDAYFVADTMEKRKIWLRYRILGDEVWRRIVRKQLLINCQIMFPEGLVYEDMYWAPLLHIYAKSAYYVERKLYHYFVGNNSTVRSKNQDYNVDSITVQLIKWMNYEKRGLLKQFKSELELDALRDAVCFIKILILRYDRPLFSLYQLEREVIRKYVPKYKNNPYLMECTEIFKFLLDALYRPMDRIEFQQFIIEARSRWTE